MMLRIATQNMFGVYADWRGRAELARPGFEQLQADAICLQETVITDELESTLAYVPEGYRVIHHPIRDREGSGISIATRLPVEDIVEVDLRLERTGDFAAVALMVELSTDVGRVLLVNHLPDWQMYHEWERTVQTERVARMIEERVALRPAHVVVAGDLDADPEAASIRFWTGRMPIADLSVAYRDAWESAGDGSDGGTFIPDNPFSADNDWPFRRIDYILVRCGEHDGPTLTIAECRRLFAPPLPAVSDHYGVVADLVTPRAKPVGAVPTG
jgi:endonuclease/exonuclease/phosphatase family metal-dependent hydrolase